MYAFCMTGQEQASHLRERIRNLGQLSGVAVNDALQDITRELTAAKPGTVTRGIRTAMSSKDEADSQPGGWGVAHLRLQVTE